MAELSALRGLSARPGNVNGGREDWRQLDAINSLLAEHGKAAPTIGIHRLAMGSWLAIGEGEDDPAHRAFRYSLLLNDMLLRARALLRFACRLGDLYRTNVVAGLQTCLGHHRILHSQPN